MRETVKLFNKNTEEEGITSGKNCPKTTTEKRH